MIKKLEREACDKETIYQEYILPVILSLEQDWINKAILPEVIFKASQRILKICEELTGDCSFLLSGEERVLIGTFGPIYTSGYSLLKSLLICQGKAVIDLGTKLTPNEFFSGSVQTGITKIYMSLFSSSDYKNLKKLLNIFKSKESILTDNLKFITGGVAYKMIPYNFSQYKNISYIEHLSDLLLEYEDEQNRVCVNG